MDIEPEEGLRRAKHEIKNMRRGQDGERGYGFSSEGKEGYLKWVAEYPTGYLLSGRQEKEEVHEEIVEIVDKVLTR